MKGQSSFAVTLLPIPIYSTSAVAIHTRNTQNAFQYRNMVSTDRGRELSPLPQDVPSAANGKYSVPCSEERKLLADGPAYAYSTWFQTPVCSLLISIGPLWDGVKLTYSFCIQPLGPTTIERLHSLQLNAESHDQGFCDVPSAGNWTWFELAIMENEYSDSPRVKDGIELTWISHLNRFCSDKYEWVRLQCLTNRLSICLLPPSESD